MEKMTIAEFRALKAEAASMGVELTGLASLNATGAAAQWTAGTMTIGSGLTLTSGLDDPIPVRPTYRLALIYPGLWS